MQTIRYTFWKDGSYYLGYWNDYPDYHTQGLSKEELISNLKELLEDIESDEIPFRHGGAHDWYTNPETKQSQPVPRHSARRLPKKERKVRMLNQMRMQDEKIISQVFLHLNISQERLLSEMAFLLASQQTSEWLMEIEYFRKKYSKHFHEFDKMFQAHNGSYEMESDWMDWKFAAESYEYWKSLLEQMQ